MNRIIAIYVAVVMVVGLIAGGLAVALVVDTMRAGGVPLLDVPPTVAPATP